jgi:hypothetical protein
MKKNKPSPVQQKELNTDIQNTAAKNSSATAATKTAAPEAAATPASQPAKGTGMTANLKITFTNTEPGLSSVTATSNGEDKTISQSDTITFQNVKTGDTIKVKGNSLGSTTITIDIDADPTQMNFDPGKINGSFFIN